MIDLDQLEELQQMKCTEHHIGANIEMLDNGTIRLTNCCCDAFYNEIFERYRELIDRRIDGLFDSGSQII